MAIMMCMINMHVHFVKFGGEAHMMMKNTITSKEQCNNARGSPPYVLAVSSWRPTLTSSTSLPVGEALVHVMLIIFVLVCRYNGQGALGTGDEQDRLYPVLVPGLPHCVQVAAAASSMALSADGQVFMWGGAAGRRLQSAKSAGRTAPVSNSSSGGAGGQDSAAAAGGEHMAQKERVPWLAGVKAVHVTCGVDTAAAVSSTGEVLLWGNKQCLPASMMGQAQTLTGTKQQGTGLETVASVKQGNLSLLQQQQELKDLNAGGGGQSLQTDALFSDTQVRSGRAGAEPAVLQPVHVELLVQPSGSVKLLISCRQQQTEDSNQCTAQPGHPTKASTAPTPQAVQQQQHQQQRSSQQFNPEEEPVTDLACGASHHVVLCQASQHIPSHGALHTSITPTVKLP